MSWFLLTTGLLVLLLGACLLLALPMVRRHHIKEIHTPADFQLDYEEVAITTSDNLTLRGYWIPHSGSNRVIILLHGFAGSMDPDLRYTPHLHKAEFNILMFDFRAHGRSDGRISSLGSLETLDVQSAVDWLQRKGYHRIGLLGFSMGARAALMAAPLIPRINAILADGCPPRLVTAVMQNLNLRGIPLLVSWPLARMMLVGASLITGKNLFINDPLFAVKRFSGIPVLYFHGEKDRFATTREISAMVQNTGPLAQLWNVPEAKHRNIEETRPTEYMQRLIDFFSETV